MGQPQWQTYRTQRPEHDTVLELFDILYERTAAFTKQHFMNPPDMYAIADIIYTQKPDLIIETGEACLQGPQGLLAGLLGLPVWHWCWLLLLAGQVDVNSPSWLANTTSWGGRARQDPMEHKLWKKRVTFIQGMSTAPEVVAQMRRAAAAATRVLVLLDSDHSSKNVQARYKTLGWFAVPGLPLSLTKVHDGATLGKLAHYKCVQRVKVEASIRSQPPAPALGNRNSSMGPWGGGQEGKLLQRRVAVSAPFLRPLTCYAAAEATPEAATTSVKVPCFYCHCWLTTLSHPSCRRIIPGVAFVTLDNNVLGRLHISMLSKERVESIEEVFAVGDELKAVVVSNVGGSVTELSTKALELVPGQMKTDKQAVFASAAEGHAQYLVSQNEIMEQRRQALSQLQQVGSVVTGTAKVRRKDGWLIALNGASALVRPFNLTQSLERGQSVQILITEIRELSAMAVATMRFEQKPDGTYQPLPRPAKSTEIKAESEPAAEPAAEPAVEPASKA
ncbi:hypothetical protein QJQ45_002182 [Haematococcus lacustris]|nr:hypothetical protein QJQ45_002182 [Haematococcus lacustris]